jgi:hypothetical protein
MGGMLQGTLLLLSKRVIQLVYFISKNLGYDLHFLDLLREGEKKYQPHKPNGVGEKERKGF